MPGWYFLYRWSFFWAQVENLNLMTPYLCIMWGFQSNKDTPTLSTTITPHPIQKTSDVMEGCIKDVTLWPDI